MSAIERLRQICAGCLQDESIPCESWCDRTYRADLDALDALVKAAQAVLTAQLDNGAVGGGTMGDLESALKAVER